MRFGATAPESSNGVAEEESVHSPEPLSSDATVDVDAERRATAIDEILDGLDRELVGLDPVKTRIREIAALQVWKDVTFEFDSTDTPDVVVTPTAV